MALLNELTQWASSVRFDDIPEPVVQRATSQVISQLAAVRTGLAHPLGQAVIRAFGSPWQDDAARGGAVLAGLSSWLQMDDTAYAGHLSNSTVNVPLAYALARGHDGRELLTAVVAANECAARITAAATLGPFRGQAATYTHLAGAICGRLHLERAPASDWANALGLAFGMPPRVLAPAFLASDTKVLHAFNPVRSAMDACDAVCAGLTGMADILEHPEGFLSRFSSIPLPEAVTYGLGTRWHTETVSYKMYPGGPGIDAAVDCAVAIARRDPAGDPNEIVDVVVNTSWYTYFVNQRVAPLVRGSDTPLGALIAWAPYAVATAVLTGHFQPADLCQPALGDARRWELAAKVRVDHDPELTRASFAAEVPFGEALRLAGKRAADWEFGRSGQRLGDLGLTDLVSGTREPSQTLTDARKVTGSRVSVSYRDGRQVVASRDIPLGAAGPHTSAHHRELVVRKFTETGGREAVARRLSDLPLLDGPAVADALRQAVG